MQGSSFERTIIDQQHLIAYASDPDTYKILYMARAAVSPCGLNAWEAYGKRCYELIQGRNTPYPFCVNDKPKLDAPYRWEHHNEKLRRQMNIIDILVPFQGKNCRLEFAWDTTRQKETFGRVSNHLSVEEALVGYIQTLSGETNTTVTVNRLLTLISHFYAAGQAYIFEYGGNVIYNTFEWCAPGVSREAENLQETPLEYITNWDSKFGHDGEFYITSLGRELVVDSSEYRILHNQGIESLSTASLMKQGKIIGFLDVDNPAENVKDLSLLHSICSFVLDEMERRRLVEELERSGYTDPLIGVSNRSCCIKKPNQLSCNTLYTLGVIHIDINGTKKLNDNLGHEYGGRVIQDVADTPHARAESNAFHMDGDEFVVLCESAKQENLQVLAKSLCRDFEESRDSEVSIGYTWEDRDILVDNETMRADDLMHAQRQGYYHTILHGGGHTRADTATKILQGVADRRFMTYYQLRISLKTGRATRTEALVRKRDDFGRFVPPDQFVPYHERECIISHLDLHVFQTVCSDFRGWVRQGVKARISPSFSRITLMASDIVQQLAQIYRDYDVPTQQLTIKVTKGISKLEAGQLPTLMHLLLGEGSSTSLDDSGSRYSNLSILTMLEFDEIEFGKSLVEELGSNIKSRVVTKNAVQICRELPKTCSLTGGTEAIEQLELLCQYQCEYGQEYYFAEPMKVEASLNLLKKEQALDVPVLTGNNPPGEE